MTGFVALSLLVSLGPVAAEALPADLASYRWERRPVLIFADAPDDPDLAAQLDRLGEAQAGLAERRVVVLTDAGADTPLRRRFEPDGFEVLLIGLDGGEKARWDHVIAPSEITARIDTMPMRRREMRAN